MPVGRIYEPPPRILNGGGIKQVSPFQEERKVRSIKINVINGASNGCRKASSPRRLSGSKEVKKEAAAEEEATTTVISVPIRIIKDPSPIRATIILPPTSEGSPKEKEVDDETAATTVSTSRPLNIPIHRKKPSPEPIESAANGITQVNESPPKSTEKEEEKEEKTNGHTQEAPSTNGHVVSSDDESLSEPDEKVGLTFITSDHAKGLRNLGNTCFMNSTIQCLAHCRQLLDLIQKGDFEHQASGKSDLTSSFAEVLLDLWGLASGGGKNRVTVDPSHFKGEIGRFAPKFSGYNQHDSQEFLQYLLEGIHNELNRVDPETRKMESKRIAERSKEEEHEDSLMDPVDYGKKSLKNYLLRDDSHLTDLFMGLFRSTLKCLNCKNESVTFEPFWVVSLPIPPKSAQPKLEDCFRLFTKEEILDGDEKPFCEKCGKTRQKCAKWYTFEKWPRILVVHFKRFESSRFRSKISSHIDVPVRNMSVGEFSSMTQFVSYDCFGISNHSGSLGGGHYTAYGRHPGDSSVWHLYNDSFVSKAGGDSVVSHEAYLLFFEKR